MSKVILDCKDLSKSYANEGVQNHVLHIDLEIRRENTVIMGRPDPKIHLLYCISGMKVGGGAVPYGDDITKFNENRLATFARNFGLCFSKFILFPIKPVEM